MRVYPMVCTSAYCGRAACEGCRHLPQLEEFKAWAARTDAKPADPIWSPLVYVTAAEREEKKNDAPR